LNTCNELINIDKAKVAELCKRQLHLRLKTAKLTKELVTFGITITGKILYALYASSCS
jgi:hypothetical protein